MSYLVRTPDGERVIEAQRAENGNGFMLFFKRRKTVLRRSETVKFGIWPFRRSETREIDDEHIINDWVCSLALSQILEITPTEESA